MRMTTLPGLDLRVSRFVFGTGGLLNVGSSRSRQRLLVAAIDTGFTHFDTAPYYGFGVAERELAPVLQAWPDVTFTTKVGLYPPGGADQPEAAVWMRKLIGRAFTRLSRPVVDFSVTSARRSLEGSLRRTGRDRIDLYLLHDPAIHLVATDEWRTWLDCCVASGKIRYFGMALSPSAITQFLGGGNRIGSLIQVRDSVAGCEADVLEHYGLTKQITYGYVVAALRADPRCCVREVLRAALVRNPNGAIVVTTRRPSRLRQYADLTEMMTHDR